MTRETKIGLLVGLAFIIVIGILLSDHMTATTEPLPAPLANTAGNVRDSVAAPVSDPPPITTVVTQTVTPREPVLTHNESMAARTGQAIVYVGPGAAQTPRNIELQQSRQQSPARTEPAPAVVNGPTGNDPLQQFAEKIGEPIVGPGSPAPAPAAAEGASRQYTAEAGDTLNKLAGRFLGANNKANRDAIVKANPSLRQDPNRIIVGHTYMIPAAATTGAAPAAGAGAAPTPAPVAKAEAPANQQQYWYTVKENDSLWSIAADQLGNGNAYTAIKELNADVLKGTDTVHPDMRLRLPAKPVASAQ